LCEGWETRHLATHLVLRERLSMLNPFVRDHQRQFQLLAARAEDPGAYARLVIEFREGSGARPLRWPGVDSLANLLEYFVHTEDVRRARVVWRPRQLGRSFDEKLWRQLTQRAGLLYRKAPTGVELILPDGRSKVVHSAPAGAGVVQIRGGAGELVLHAHGRPRSALVTLDGAETDIAALRAFRVRV
jgi:uncharacterized protein (TIGR03085 family)